MQELTAGRRMIRETAPAGEGGGMSASSVTAQAARFAVSPATRFPADVLESGRLSFFDWFAVALAGAAEPVSRAVRRLVRDEGGAARASAFGLPDKLPARAAALLNGTVSHALDYDDTHFAYVGHPSVAVLPAALAVAQQQNADGKALLEAFLTGVETTCRVGGWLGRSHYDAGFHQTATAGTFGATAACARLLGLNANAAAQALGLAATRASGLKCQFGTMAKPFHAGMAAANGVEAASLAALGFLARSDALECEGGFSATHRGQQDGGPCGNAPPPFLFPQVQYKFHACCHGTHAALEALLALRDEYRLTSDDVASVRLGIHRQWLPVCCIPEPASGLEAKFSLAMTAAMVLAGIDTAALDSFTDSVCRDRTLRSVAGRVAIHADATLTDTACHAVIVTVDGRQFERTIELGAPLPEQTTRARLQAKAATLVGPDRANALWALTESLHTLPAADLYPQVHALMAGAAS